MTAVYVLEWIFSPANYFEELIHIQRDNYEMWIEPGKVEARVAEEFCADHREMREKLHTALNDRFLGVQLVTYKPYQLSQPSMYKLNPDGRKDV